MNSETSQSTPGNEKPPARPIFRKLSWVIAAISFFMALVVVSGLMGDDGKLTLTLIFFFCGFVFTTIALTGSWPAQGVLAEKTKERANLVIAAFCLLCFVQGLETVSQPDLFHRLLGWVSIVAGGVGMIAGVMAFLKQRKQVKQ